MKNLTYYMLCFQLLLNAISNFIKTYKAPYIIPAVSSNRCIKYILYSYLVLKFQIVITSLLICFLKLNIIFFVGSTTKILRLCQGTYTTFILNILPSTMTDFRSVLKPTPTGISLSLKQITSWLS